MRNIISEEFDIRLIKHQLQAALHSSHIPQHSQANGGAGGWAVEPITRHTQAVSWLTWDNFQVVTAITLASDNT